MPGFNQHFPLPQTAEKQMRETNTVHAGLQSMPGFSRHFPLCHRLQPVDWGRETHQPALAGLFLLRGEVRLKPAGDRFAGSPPAEAGGKAECRLKPGILWDSQVLDSRNLLLRESRIAPAVPFR